MHESRFVNTLSALITCTKNGMFESQHYACTLQNIMLRAVVSKFSPNKHFFRSIENSALNRNYWAGEEKVLGGKSFLWKTKHH